MVRTKWGVYNPSSHLTDYHCYFALSTLHEPHTYRKASTNPLWQQAITNELDTLHKTHTWDMIALPPRKSAIGCKWVYKIKTRTNGSVECYKARLVVKGFTQEYGMDYEETCAPVARFTSVRSLLAIVVVCHLPLFQMDVKIHFLMVIFSRKYTCNHLLVTIIFRINFAALVMLFMALSKLLGLGSLSSVMWLLNRVSLLIHIVTQIST